MAEFDMTQATWRFHHSLGVAHPPNTMEPAGPNGPNTDVVLRFVVADPGFSIAEPPPASGALESMQGTWYRGYVAVQEDAWDTDDQIGRVWVRVVSETHDAFRLILLIQEGFALPATPAVNGELQVRIYTGRYVMPGEYFGGYGADNWGGSGGLFTFTLTPEAAL